ncbi:MAG: hypothetical protein HQM12_19020 [SAR324 cluster bacterium]|nr:hypothetical protein [SAR324 cluster bacterium]
MTLLRNGIDLYIILKEFISNSKRLFIFVPYIKLESLKQLLSETNNCKAIIVRWEAKDLIQGSSDLEVFQYCQEKNITLYRNSRLHLKAFIDDYNQCIIGSPNISSRALNLPPNNSYNYELATIIDYLEFEDRLYFARIVNESLLITPDIYKQIVNQLIDCADTLTDETELKFADDSLDKAFLISSLPMTSTVETLLNIFKTRENANEVELNCALHDLALYNVPLDLTPEDAYNRLKASFFSHSFIQAFLKNLEKNREIYFGASKAWIQNNCTNVPVPRKWEITQNIQILYKWIVELGEGKYKIDVPGHRSERLSIV